MGIGGGSNKKPVEQGSVGSGSSASTQMYDPELATYCLRDAVLRYKQNGDSSEIEGVAGHIEIRDDELAIQCLACTKMWRLDADSNAEKFVVTENGGCGVVDSKLVAAIIHPDSAAAR